MIESVLVHLEDYFTDPNVHPWARRSMARRWLGLILFTLLGAVLVGLVAWVGP